MGTPLVKLRTRVSSTLHAVSRLRCSRVTAGSLNDVWKNCSVAPDVTPVSRILYSSSCETASSAPSTPSDERPPNGLLAHITGACMLSLHLHHGGPIVVSNQLRQDGHFLIQTLHGPRPVIGHYGHRALHVRERGRHMHAQLGQLWVEQTTKFHWLQVRGKRP